jgi:glucosamine-6-phosphate deaminase
VRLVVADDYASLSRKGAEIVADIVLTRPEAAIVLATGNTPMGTYRELAAIRARTRELDVSRIRVFQLDDYLGVGPDDPRSLYAWMMRSVIEPLGIREDQVTRLPGDASDPVAACRAYDQAVGAAGGLDLAVLGLGPNGHLGFNEPPVLPEAPTRTVELAVESIASNARYWGSRDRVPRMAVTAGMVQLLASRATLLLVSGARKRGILRRTVDGPVTPDVPASYLQRSSEVTVLADRDASALLR